ncbi:hypothetical protein SHIRM173S_01504 [Streptomyces hirsutus]
MEPGSGSTEPDARAPPLRTNPLESRCTPRTPTVYADLPYRRTGRSGLITALSLGLWHNFGPDRPAETQRAILRRAFDLGVTRFDPRQQLRPAPRCRQSPASARPCGRTSRRTATTW